MRQRIIKATRDHARIEAAAAVSVFALALARDKPSVADVLAPMQALLDTRWFDLVVRLGGALRAAGYTQSPIARRFAQALIEKRLLAQARTLLIEQLQGPPDGEFGELYGLLGRTYKQMYIERLRSDGEASSALWQHAIDAYDAGYRLNEAENTWHGMNLVACLRYAARHAIAVASPLDADQIVGDVFAYLDAKNALTQWDIGTRAEALLDRALEGKGSLLDALHALRAYAEHTKITAFNLNSTLRQFEEIWELDTCANEAQNLLILLRARLTEIENGSVSIAPIDVRALQGGNATIQLEAAFGSARFTALDWFRTAIKRCGGVAKISNDTGEVSGTGFLMRGSDLRADWGEEAVLLTNDHVVSTVNARAIRPRDAKVRFEASDTVSLGQAHDLGEILFNSPQDQLDVTIARLSPPISGENGLERAESIPNAGGGRVLIIGHPDGRSLSFSIMDNQLLAANALLLHYRAPTEGGSSGSPVFSMQWKVVGLHHAGGHAVPRIDGVAGTYEANEGIRLDAIVQAVQSAP